MAKRYSKRRSAPRSRSYTRPRSRVAARRPRARSSVRRTARGSRPQTIRIVVEQTTANPISRPELVQRAANVGGKPKL